MRLPAVLCCAALTVLCCAALLQRITIPCLNLGAPACSMEWGPGSALPAPRVLPVLPILLLPLLLLLLPLLNRPAALALTTSLSPATCSWAAEQGVSVVRSGSCGEADPQLPHRFLRASKPLVFLSSGGQHHRRGPTARAPFMLRRLAGRSPRLVLAVCPA